MKLTANATREIDIYYEVHLTENEVWELAEKLEIEIDSLDDLTRDDLEMIWEQIMWDNEYDIEEDIGDGSETLYDYGVSNGD